MILNMVRQIPHRISAVSWLRVARIARRLSQAELAEISGVSRVTITHLENTSRPRPHRRTEERLAAALGYAVEELFPGPGVSPSPELRDWYHALNGTPKTRARREQA
jgi:transcriptional regulator with XRE-family HTH domain